ncbi:DUF6414 family protein [Actinomycetota bacterium]
MALRNPIYLDLEQLIAQAEYHDVAVPRAEEIVETSRSQRRAGAKLGLSGAGVDAGGEREVETQSTFRLEPRQRSTVSKVIDRLHREQVISTASSLTDSAIQKDDLVELDGILRMTPTTLAGKLFYLMKKAIASSDIASIEDLSIDDPEVEDVIRTVYLENELLPIPILMQAVDTGMEVRVYVNINPSHFTTSDVADRLEGEHRVLGTVRSVIDGGDEGYYNAEEWLMPGWEYMIRRLMLASLDDREIHSLFTQMGLKIPEGATGTHVAGPAVLIDAIALY